MVEKKKFISLSVVLLVLIAVLLGIVVNIKNSTSTRYIKREKDEVKAYYTSLYMDATGEGNGIILENNVGSTSFEFKNYIDEDVTKRNIEYKIDTVSEFYDKSGNIISDPYGKDLYVLDLWGQPTKIENDTCKYEVSIESNNGQVAENGNYLFEYEERGSSAVGKTHKITLRLERKASASITPISNIEKLSIVIQIIKPYKTIYVINMFVSNRLILFSDLDIELFEMPFKALQIQTANFFNYTRLTSFSEMNTSKAFKLTVDWNGLILNENTLKNIHNNIFDLLGTTDASNLDISKPYIVQLDQDSDKGTLVIYVPQSSNFNLNFFTRLDNYEVKVKVEIYCEDTKEYEGYTSDTFGGYELDANNYMIVMKSGS